MDASNYRNTQTQVKHEILSRYLDTWGGIILHGLRNAKAQRKWHFVYVDCFSFIGKYDGDKDDIFRLNQNLEPRYGSPIIGIRALDKLALMASKYGLEIVTNSILIEKDRKNFQQLQVTLDECNFEQRVKFTAQFDKLSNHEISLINEDAISLVDNLISFTNQKYVWAFYLIDPYGPTGIPFDFIQKIICCNHHDVLINFVYEDLLRKSGMFFNEKLESQHKGLIENWKNAFGDEIWNNIVLKSFIENKNLLQINKDSSSTSIQNFTTNEFNKERLLTDAYCLSLHKMDPTIAIKLIALQFPDKARTMFYLFLTTHDPTGALALNEILFKAKLLEYELRYELVYLKQKPKNQLSLLDPVEFLPINPTLIKPNIETISNEIYKLFQGKTLSLKDIYMGLIDTLYFKSDINKSLIILKKQGKLKYNGNLANRTIIKFL